MPCQSTLPTKCKIMFKTILCNKNANLLLFPKCYSTATLQPISKILTGGKVGENVEVKGWIKALRNQKENVFLDLSDGTTDKKLQVLLSKELRPERLSTGSSVVATGLLSLSPKGQLELTANSLEVYGECVVADGYPFAPRKQYSPDYVRQYLHFRPRTNKFSALLRVRNAATLAVHNYFNSEGFVNIHTPVLTSNDCEGAGEVFRVVPESDQILKSMTKPGQNKDEAYFNTKTYLSVSGQLHLEAAAYGLSKVYSFGTTFRAENSRSRLHLSEFYMIEAEIAFAENIEQITKCIEKLIKSVTKTVLNQSMEDVERCCENKLDVAWLEKDFRVMTYQEATDVLENSEYKGFDKNDGFGKEHELFLVEHCGNIPIFVINWPIKLKPFYMRELGNGNVAALDLLVPNVGELVGGGLRENDYEKLKQKILQNNLEGLDWYFELRKFGRVPTGGFGLGFERYLQLLLGIRNIKDVIPYPRWPHNCAM